MPSLSKACLKRVSSLTAYCLHVIDLKSILFILALSSYVKLKTILTESSSYKELQGEL